MVISDDLKGDMHAVLAELPRCNNGNCQRPATYATSVYAGDREAHYLGCDVCHKNGFAVDELPHAQAIRNLVAASGYWPKAA